MSWVLASLSFLVLGGSTTMPAEVPVVCSNPAGECELLQGSGSCECGDGDGSAWSDGYNPDDPPEPKTEEELLAECNAVLVETCGEDPPSLPPTCEGEVLTECEAYVEAENALLQACGDEVPEVDIARVGACCDSFDNPDYATYRDCIMAVENPTCDALLACESMGGAGQGNAAGDSAEDADELSEDDDTKASCSVVPHGSTGQPFALLALLAFLRRRSRTH